VAKKATKKKVGSAVHESWNLDGKRLKASSKQVARWEDQARQAIRAVRFWGSQSNLSRLSDKTLLEELCEAAGGAYVEARAAIDPDESDESHHTVKPEHCFN
jgi:hypothetical protein